MVRVGNVALVRAGWLTERSGGYWEITPKGEQALDRLSSANDFLKAAAKHSLRARAAIAFPALYIALRRWKYQLSVDYHLVRRVGLRNVLRQPPEMGPSWEKVLPMQSTGIRDDRDIAEYLIVRGAHHSDTPLFLSRTEAMNSPLAIVAAAYPDRSSLVVLQSAKAAGSGEDRSCAILIANLLHARQCGPKLYDLVHVDARNQRYSIFVIEGDDLRKANAQESIEGRARLSELEEEGLIGFASRYREFASSETGTDRSFVVDREGNVGFVAFEDIELKDYESYLNAVATDAIECSHFGDRSLLRGGHYLYQSIPGVRLPARRNTERRMATICRLMESIGATFENQLVLDIGCNIGMMMAEYLRLGVGWCHGWDRIDVAPHAEQLLRALGCTRFSMTGCDIAQSASLADDLPEFVKPRLDGCIISYLAVRKNLGFLECLGQIPWSLMIYEGHEEETEAHFQKYLDDLRRFTRIEVKAIDTYHDGDCGERIIAMIARSE